MSKTSIRINKGPSFKGLISTFSGIYLIVSLIMLVPLFGTDNFENPWQSILFIVVTAPIAAILFLVLLGVEIDLEKGRIRGYRNYILFRIGKWNSLKEYDLLILERERFKSKSTTPTGTHINHRFSFNVLLRNSVKNRLLIIKECSDYKEARLLLDKVSKLLNMEVQDLELEAIKKLKSKRHLRR